LECLNSEKRLDFLGKCNTLIIIDNKIHLCLQGFGLVANGHVVKVFVLLSMSRVQTSTYLEAVLVVGVVLPRGYKAADEIRSRVMRV
jgi:hypothetical protein